MTSSAAAVTSVASQGLCSKVKSFIGIGNLNGRKVSFLSHWSSYLYVAGGLAGTACIITGIALGNIPLLLAFGAALVLTNVVAWYYVEKYAPLASFESSMQKMRKEVKTVQEANKKLQQNLERAQATTKKMRKLVAEKEEYLQNLEDQTAVIEARFNRVNKKLEKTGREYGQIAAQMERQKEELGAKIQGLVAENKKLGEYTVDLMKTLNTFNDEGKEKFGEDVAELESLLATYKETNDDVSDELDRLKKFRKKLKPCRQYYKNTEKLASMLKGYQEIESQVKEGTKDFGKATKELGKTVEKLEGAPVILRDLAKAYKELQHLKQKLKEMEDRASGT